MLHFTLKQLRYVAAAGREGSIANAANSLNISQSSITAAIEKTRSCFNVVTFFSLNCQPRNRHRSNTRSHVGMFDRVGKAANLQMQPPGQVYGKLEPTNLTDDNITAA